MIWFVYLAVAAAGMLIHLWRDPSPRTPLRIVEVVLLYLLVMFVGVGGLTGAVGHTFYARDIALKIGWPPGSPFQWNGRRH